MISFKNDFWRSGYRLPNRANSDANLTILIPLLESWLRVEEEYFRRAEDPPWIYGERTHVGLFAAGAWIRGWLALEEWRGDKASENVGFTGRYDLWLYNEDKMKPRPEFTEFFVEAKYGKCGLENIDAAIDSVTEGLNSADCSASQLDKVFAQEPKRLSFFFARLFTSQSKSTDEIKDEIELMNKRLEKSPGTLKLDAWAWLVGDHDLTKRIAEESDQVKRSIDLGIALFVRRYIPAKV